MKAWGTFRKLGKFQKVSVKDRFILLDCQIGFNYVFIMHMGKKSIFERSLQEHKCLSILRSLRPGIRRLFSMCEDVKFWPEAHSASGKLFLKIINEYGHRQHRGHHAENGVLRMISSKETCICSPKSLAREDNTSINSFVLHGTRNSVRGGQKVKTWNVFLFSNNEHKYILSQWTELFHKHFLTSGAILQMDSP